MLNFSGIGFSVTNRTVLYFHAGLLYRFSVPISGTCVMGIRIDRQWGEVYCVCHHLLYVRVDTVSIVSCCGSVCNLYVPKSIQIT